jgi:hypothetical protein
MKSRYNEFWFLGIDQLLEFSEWTIEALISKSQQLKGKFIQKRIHKKIDYQKQKKQKREHLEIAKSQEISADFESFKANRKKNDVQEKYTKRMQQLSNKNEQNIEKEITNEHEQ